MADEQPNLAADTSYFPSELLIIFYDKRSNPSFSYTVILCRLLQRIVSIPA
jgi:hypothetical protein